MTTIEEKQLFRVMSEHMTTYNIECVHECDSHEEAIEVISGQKRVFKNYVYWVINVTTGEIS